MNDKEFQRRMAYESLIILGLLALLLFITRLWPILLLVILGIFIAALRLLFLAVKRVETLEPAPQLPRQSEPSEADVQNMAWSLAQKRITELVLADFSEARWVWETPHAMEAMIDGRELFILLNRAGGYRRARVVVKDLHVCALIYEAAQEMPSEKTQSEEDADTPETQEDETSQNTKPNYEYLAFEWVEAHTVELNERCNEAIANGLSTLLLEATELPVSESWPEICRELARDGMESCECVQDGIIINLTQ